MKAESGVGQQGRCGVLRGLKETGVALGCLQVKKLVRGFCREFVSGRSSDKSGLRRAGIRVFAAVNRT